MARLKAYVGLLEDWNARHNLVSAGSLADVWRRHIWDSAQLVRFIPDDAKTLADLGSGAGFPGLVLAELLRGRTKITLFEATAKKCAFLQAVAERHGTERYIRNTRIEDAGPRPSMSSPPAPARRSTSCSPMHSISWARDTVCLFLKGQNVGV